MSQIRIEPKRKWDGRIDPNEGYVYALVYMISEIRLITIDQWETIDMSECLEARLFGENAELHLFREDDTVMCTAVRDLSGGSETETEKEEIRSVAFIDRVHAVRSNCRTEIPGFSRLIIREYISYDSDGQAFTVRTRLKGLQ